VQNHQQPHEVIMKQLLLICAVVMGQSVLAADKKQKNNAEAQKAISEAINKISKLQLTRKGISDLSFISHLTHLKRFDVGYNQITDLSPIFNLEKLEALNVRENKIKNLKPLAELKSLTFLSVENNQIQDVSHLSKLTNMEILVLNNNQIKDIRPLGSMTKLFQLNLLGNPIKDISVVKNFKGLRLLYLQNMPNVTKAQIDELQKALPKCKILSNPTN